MNADLNYNSRSLDFITSSADVHRGFFLKWTDCCYKPHTNLFNIDKASYSYYTINEHKERRSLTKQDQNESIKKKHFVGRKLFHGYLLVKKIICIMAYAPY